MVNSQVYELVIPGRIPSKKNSKRLCRGRIISSQDYMDWESAQIDRLRHLALNPLPWGCVGCDAYFWHSDARAYDLSNKWESIADLLVKVGFLKDDNWKVLAPISLYSMGISRSSPGVLLRFWDSSNDDATAIAIPNPLDYFPAVG